MIRLALIGLGNMGSLHFKNIKKLENDNICKLNCVCDINKTLTDEYSHKYLVNGYYCVDDMLDNDTFDAAIVAVTSNHHFNVAKKLIERDKPLLVEKPVAISAKEAEELNKIVLKKNILLSAGYTEVYNSVTAGIKDYLKNDKYFEYIDFFRIGLKSKRNDSKDIDVIQDLITHDLAVLAEISDADMINEISGTLSAYNTFSNKYDFTSVSVSLNNGIIARFLADRNSSVKIRKFNISSENMFGEFDFMDQTARIMKKGTIEAFGDNIWYTQNFDSLKIRYSNNPLLDEIADFVFAVQNGRETKTSKKWFQITKSIEKIREALYKNDRLR